MINAVRQRPTKKILETADINQLGTTSNWFSTYLHLVFLF
jgi:hypothetical protein